jgi:hypothetical protein
MQQTLQSQNDMYVEQMNYLSDTINATVGFEVSPRIPVRRPVIVSGGNIQHNHIAVSNSQIGILNTGNIENLNQTIDNLYSISQDKLAKNLKDFSEAVVNESNLQEEQKNEILESLDVITQELFKEPAKQKRSVIKTLITGITGTTQFAANAWTIWQVLTPLLLKFFQ